MKKSPGSRLQTRAARTDFLPALVVAMAGVAGLASAQTSGTWTNTVSGGLWSGAGNWSGGIVADGSGATGFFNSVDITVDHTVHLDTARTIGSLTFGDAATNTPAGWVLDNNGDAANILTLAGGTPTITVGALGTNRIDRVATISAEIAGSGGFTKAGVGALNLTASNTYAGPTTVSGGGILTISNPGALGDTNGGTTVASGNQLRLVGGITIAGEPLTISGSVSDAMGRGALRSVGGSNVWAGPITIAGTSETWINAASAPITLTGGITGSNASLRLDQGSQLVTGMPIDLGATGSLLVNSSARLAIAGNTFGTLRVDWNGSLRTEVAGAVPTNVTLVMGTGGPSSAGVGALDLFGNSQTVARLMDGGTNHANEVINNTSATAATFSINQSSTSTYLGRIAGNLAVTKGGVGALTLGGSNTYSGATAVSNGTLRVNGRHIGGGQYTVASGATLGGTGVISASLVSLVGGIIDPGSNSAAIGSLTFNGNADLDGTLKIEINSSGLGSTDLLRVTGSLDITSATVDFDLLAGALDDGAYIFAEYGTLVGTFAGTMDLPSNYTIDYAYGVGGNRIALIPEPSAFSLALLCVGAMAVWRRRRRAVG